MAWVQSPVRELKSHKLCGAGRGGGEEKNIGSMGFLFASYIWQWWRTWQPRNADGPRQEKRPYKSQFCLVKEPGNEQLNNMVNFQKIVALLHPKSIEKKCGPTPINANKCQVKSLYFHPERTVKVMPNPCRGGVRKNRLWSQDFCPHWVVMSPHLYDVSGNHTGSLYFLSHISASRHPSLFP